MKYEWDDEKNTANQAKHGVSFNEAKEFLDGAGYSIDFDSEHSSHDEDAISPTSLKMN